MKPTSLLANTVRVLVILAAVLSGSSLLHAQTATIGGSVVDSSGAPAKGVTVTATNVATHLDRSTVTSDTGAYRISSLPPSVYTVAFSLTGFKTVHFENVTLTVDQALTVDAKMEVGSVSTSVEVTATAAPPVDTTDATLSNVVEHKQMTELPLILRDPYQLVLLGPGVTQSDADGGVSVNGARDRNNNFRLDGADNNDADVPGSLGGVTSQNPDSTQEFRVLTNNFAPEFGRNNGAIVDVITRSGSNDFHGDTFYFGRWDALGARDYFNNSIDLNTGSVVPKNPYIRNLYGGSVGGPIRKDRTFFFLNYQGDRFITNVTNSSIVPTQAFRTGIFTYTNPTGGASQAINLITPTAGDGQNGTAVGLDPLVQKIFGFYPTPSVASGDGVTGTLFFPSESREKDEDATLRIDQRISNNNNLFVRYIYNWFNDPNPFHTDSLPGGLGATPSSQKTQGIVLGLTSTLGSTWVNDLRFGANRVNLFFGCFGISDFNSIGFVDGVGHGADYQFPVFANFGCTEPNNSDATISKAGTYQTSDDLSKVLYSHTLKWGAEFRDVYSNNFTDFSSRENLTFNVFSQSGVPTLNQSTLNPGVDSLVLEDMVGALLGLVNSAGQTQFFTSSGARVPNDELNFRQRELGLYMEDSWKLRPNLTLTYGLRWEYYGVPFEVNHNLSNLFVDPSMTAASFTFLPVGPGTGRLLYNNYYRDFQPRFGFAWDPFKTGRTSVRGGIGLFSDRVYGNLAEDPRGDPPFHPSFLDFPTFNFGPVAAAQLQNQPTPGNLVPSAVVPNGSGIFPDLFDHNIKPPSLVSWNLGVQRQVNSNLSVEANYVGNHGTRILRVVDGNPPQPALVSQLLGMGVNPALLEFQNLWFGGDPGGPLPFNAVNNNAFYHTFTDQSSGHSWYDALQLQITERAFHGLQIQGAYTFAHALDDSTDPLVTNIGDGNYPINSFDLPREKGNSGLDTRHRGVVNFIYQPNIGRGQSHWANGVAGRIFEGWELSGIAAWQTGTPYDIFGTLDTLHTGFADRATVVNAAILKTPPTNPNQGVPSSPVFTGFNPAAFNPDDGSIPIPWGVPSSVGRNNWYGPGINNWNANIAKTTALTEKLNLQLRFEFYNLFNRVQFTKPGNVVGTPLFGYSTGQIGQNDGTTGARQLQVAAKLTF